MKIFSFSTCFLVLQNCLSNVNCTCSAAKMRKRVTKNYSGFIVIYDRRDDETSSSASSEFEQILKNYYGSRLKIEINMKYSDKKQLNGFSYPEFGNKCISKVSIGCWYFNYCIRKQYKPNKTLECIQLDHGESVNTLITALFENRKLIDECINHGYGECYLKIFDRRYNHSSYTMSEDALTLDYEEFEEKYPYAVHEYLFSREDKNVEITKDGCSDKFCKYKNRRCLFSNVIQLNAEYIGRLAEIISDIIESHLDTQEFICDFDHNFLNEKKKDEKKMELIMKTKRIIN